MGGPISTFHDPSGAAINNGLALISLLSDLGGTQHFSRPFGQALVHDASDCHFRSTNFYLAARRSWAPWLINCWARRSPSVTGSVIGPRCLPRICAEPSAATTAPSSSSSPFAQDAQAAMGTRQPLTERGHEDMLGSLAHRCCRCLPTIAEAHSTTSPASRIASVTSASVMFSS